MAFEEVVSNFKYYSLTTRQGTLTEEGEKLLNQVLVEGYFIQEEAGRFGTQYHFRDETRGIVVLGGGQIAQAVKTKSIELGDYVQITFTGLKEIEKGANKGAMMKSYKILRDKERRIEPNQAASLTVSNTEDTIAATEQAESIQNAVAEVSQTVANTAHAAPASSTNDLLTKYKK
jgi:hypothetical protein